MTRTRCRTTKFSYANVPQGEVDHNMRQRFGVTRDEAFLYSEAIDLTTYGRQRDRLREELTLAKIDHHAEAVDELDVEGILAFAERILPRASDLWVQATLDYKQRLQELFFPEGIAFDGNRFNRTATTAPLFKYLAPSESADEKLVRRGGIEPPTRRLRVCCSAN